jgi:hypothetical protein
MAMPNDHAKPVLDAKGQEAVDTARNHASAKRPEPGTSRSRIMKSGVSRNDAGLTTSKGPNPILTRRDGWTGPGI